MLEVSRRARLQGNRALRFEGNAQTFHILVAAEPKSPDYPGLNLTRATLAGVMKYPYEQDIGNEKFIFTSDIPSARWAIRGGTQLLSAREKKRETLPNVSYLPDPGLGGRLRLFGPRRGGCSPGAILTPGRSRGSCLCAMRRQTLRGNARERRCSRTEPRRNPGAAALPGRTNPRSGDGDERAHRKKALRNIVNELVISVSVEFFAESRRADYSWALVVPSEPRILSCFAKPSSGKP